MLSSHITTIAEDILPDCAMLRLVDEAISG
jgi:hypothetical protein